MEEMVLREIRTHGYVNCSTDKSSSTSNSPTFRPPNSPGGDKAECAFTKADRQERKSPSQYTDEIDWSTVVKTLLPSHGRTIRSMHHNFQNFYDVSYYATMPRRHKNFKDSCVARRLESCLSEVKCQNKCWKTRRCHSFHEFNIEEPFKKSILLSAKNAQDAQNPVYCNKNEYCDPRLLPVPMAKKREYRNNFANQYLDYYSMKTKIDKQRHELKEHTFDIWNIIKAPFNFWNSSLKRIEGHYGTGIVSYFLFLRWMVYLNLLMTILLISFVVIPESIYYFTEHNAFNNSVTNHTFSSVDQEVFNNFKYTPLYYSVDSNGKCHGNASISHTKLVSFCSSNYSDSVKKKNSNAFDKMQEFLQGTGWMELSPMFIGWYKPSVMKYSDLLSWYDLPTAYMLVTLSYFLLCLILMVFYTRKSIRENILNVESRLQQYCNMVFSGWDFCIEDKKLAEIKHGNILQKLKSHLAESRRYAEISQWSTHKRVCTTFLRVMINIAIIVILGGLGYGIYTAILQAEEAQGTKGLDALLKEYLPSIIITTLNLFLPLLFTLLEKFEQYSLSFTIKITLIRCVFSQLASICVLIGTLHTLIMCDDKGECGNGYGKCKAPMCWETYVGQQIYKLVLLDFAIVTLLTVFIGYFRKVFVQHFHCKLAQLIGREEFNIPRNVLGLVYSQTLCWLGAFYSPFLPLISLIKCLIFFYVNKFSLFVNCGPTKQSYKASRSNTFFMIVLMLSYLIGVFSFIYSISIIMPSRGCGPFRMYNMAWDTVHIFICKFPSTIIKILYFIGSAGFGIPAFIILSLLLYYYLTISATYSEMADVLKNHLFVEAQDKQFLLQKLMIILRQPER